ncbi:putative reverse transcriptase domain-containing protein [Tanacetum coccineum]
MSTSNHPIIVPSDSDIEDAFSSTHSPDYTPASPDYFPASPGNTSSNPSDDLSKYLLASQAISTFHDARFLPTRNRTSRSPYQISGKIAKSLTGLTQKNKKYIWGEDQESAFQLLKQKLCEAPILALPEGNDDFVIYCDASHQGLGAVLMQREKVIAYAS